MNLDKTMYKKEFKTENIYGENMFDNIMFFFVIGSFVGWIFEILFKTISKEDISKAGMANGPFCVLYGIGTLLLTIVVSKYINNLILVFIISSILLTTLEYVAGLLLDKVYGIELWNYNKLMFGINKYISVEFMLAWGILGVVFIKYCLPFLNNIYFNISSPIVNFMIYSILMYILIDYMYTSVKLLNMKNNVIK
jgi:uncharacterized membrane protein